MNVRNYNDSIGRFVPNIPKNGHERVVADTDNNKHLQMFMNGSWRHSHRCREYTNKDCKIKIYGK